MSDHIAYRQSMFDNQQARLINNLEATIETIERVKRDVLDGRQVPDFFLGNLINGMGSLQPYAEARASLEALRIESQVANA